MQPSGDVSGVQLAVKDKPHEWVNRVFAYFIFCQRRVKEMRKINPVTIVLSTFVIVVWLTRICHNNFGAFKLGVISE